MEEVVAHATRKKFRQHWQTRRPQRRAKPIAVSMVPEGPQERTPVLTSMTENPCLLRRKDQMHVPELERWLHLRSSCHASDVASRCERLRRAGIEGCSPSPNTCR